MKTSQERVWQVSWVVGILLVVYLAALSIGQLKSIKYIGSDIVPTNTISVSGTGDSYAVPDVATFSFSVNETAKTVTAAQAAATAKTTAALKAVRASGVEDKDIQTTSYNISPHYDYQNGACTAGGICTSGKSVLTGYDVGQTITVKVRNLDKAGEIFASIGTLEVQNVNGLNFAVDKPEAIQSQARATAIADAKTKADQLASQLGVSLGRIVSFSEDNSNYPRPVMYAMDSMAGSVKAAAPEIPAGQQKITDNVTIVYEIR